MAVSFTAGNDFIIPTEDGQTYLGGAGDDTYILSDSTIVANSTIVIQDTEGDNTIQLVGGLSITSSTVTGNAVELTLSNGAKIQILNAETFGYDVGGNALAGLAGTAQTFTEFVEDTLGTTVPAAGEPASVGGAVEVESPAPPLADTALSINDVSVTEGDSGTVTASFTVTLGSAPGAGESVTVDYATADVTADAGFDYVAASGTLTFAAGETTKTIDVTVNGDTDIEPDETFAVNLSNATGSIGGVAATIAKTQGVGTIVTDDVAVPGETFELTTGSDNITGTDGDDTINAPISEITQTGALQDTFQNVDIIDGGDGNDTLKVQTQSADQVTPTINNVENIEYTSFSGQMFNLQNTTGVEAISNVSSAGDLVLNNIDSVVDLTLKNVKGVDTSLVYNTSAVGAPDDTQKITLNGVSAAGNTQASVDLNSAQIETLWFEAQSAGDRVNIADADYVEGLVFKGDGDARVGFTGNKLATNASSFTGIDAAKATGNIRVDLTDTATNLVDTAKYDSKMSLVTGSGDDRIDLAFTSDAAVKDFTIDLGTGSDTLVVATAADITNAVAMTNVNTLQLSGGNRINLDKATALETVNFMGALDETNRLDNVAAKADTINFIGTSTALQTLSSVDYRLKDTSGSKDELNLNVSNINVNTGAAQDKTAGVVTTINTVTANGIETINLGTANLGAYVAKVGSTPEQLGGLALGTLAADALTTLNIDATTLVNLTGVTLGTTVKTVDASKSTGAVRMNMGSAADSGTTPAADKIVTIKTGSGNDVITGIDNAVKTDVNLGEGNNKATVTLQTDANQTINSGAGKDTLTVDGAAAGTSVFTANLGTGEDKVVVGANISFAANGSKLTFGSGDDDTGTIEITGGSAVNFSNLGITNLDSVTLNSAGINYVFDFATLNDQTIEFNNFASTGGAIQLASGDTIDMSLSATTGQFTHADLDGITFNGTHNLNTVIVSAGDDTITLNNGTTITQTVKFNATAAGSAGSNGNSINQFNAGAGNDVLDFTAFFANATNTTQVGDGADEDLIAATKTVVTIDNSGTAIAGKDYAGTDFAELFGTTGGTTAFLDIANGTAGANSENIIIIQGSDETQIFYVENDATAAIAANEVSLVGVLESNVTELSADNVADVTTWS